MINFNNFFYNDRLTKNIFFISLFFKIIISFFYGSFYLSDLFLPFINYASEVSILNPYSHFHQQGIINAFPYPGLMLLILSIPQYLLGWLTENKHFDYFLFRLPLILADLTILFTAHSWLSKKFFYKFFYLYWLSPVLFYISYIYGQVDIIPIALLFLSLTFLYKENFLLSSLFLGLSLATKTMVIICFPFIFLFLLKKDISFLKILIFFIIALLFFLLPNIPYLFTNHFFEMVFQNSEQVKIFNAKFIIMNSEIYLIPLFFTILLIRCYLFKKINRDIFNMFLGFSFGIILLCVEPREGWYFWLLPFLFYFFSKSSNKSIILIFILQLFYFMYFFSNEIVNYYNSLFNLNNSVLIENLIFTFLQSILLVNCFFIYQYGLISYTRYKLFYQNFLLGIGGDSGSGKSTLSDAFSKIFYKSNITIVKGDDIHKWERNDTEWQDFTHLDPKANDLHLDIKMLQKLKRGKQIKRRKYDHMTGKFLNKKLIVPKNLIIYEGLLPFFLEKQRDQFDLKVFISPNIDLVKFWKINRDFSLRNKTLNDIINQINQRKYDSDTYIKTQQKFADITIIPKINNTNNYKERITKLINSELILENDELTKILNNYKEEEYLDYVVIFPNSISFENIIREFKNSKKINISHRYLDSKFQEISISGKIKNIEINNIAKITIPGLEHVGIVKSIWPNDSYGLVLLFIVFMIFDEVNIDS
jgi:uridine kinase